MRKTPLTPTPEHMRNQTSHPAPDPRENTQDTACPPENCTRRNPIRRVRLMLEYIAGASDRKNVDAAIELLHSGVTISAGQVVSDGKLIHGQD